MNLYTVRKHEVLLTDFVLNIHITLKVPYSPIFFIEFGIIFPPWGAAVPRRQGLCKHTIRMAVPEDLTICSVQ